ncbi:cupin domain-containing protein [Candidatus Venteria ishoeyi]|uniref:cupin domain-containing protein n=1 Tax=Candidatus Venteria ishoeyi TaxID=1899563 RepID=UPI0025A5BA5C|nr:cupin domain-containing protein [Candidatus Venteria ishoeyi]MDM8546515.1 cupin domain-containing protein [Candidatus Venteria ishoeyi]
MPHIYQLFKGLEAKASAEIFTELLQGQQFRLERIVSTGQATAADTWYDQDEDEWVILLSGKACLHFADEAQAHELLPGDYVFIPAHCRHRVTWTDPEQISVWLALHIKAEPGKQHFTAPCKDAVNS